MTRIAKTLSKQRDAILKATAELLPLSASGVSFARDELLEQAGMTLDLLIESESERDVSFLFDRWEAIGKICAQRDLALDEFPDMPFILKHAIWLVMRPLVESGKIKLADLIDQMMGTDTDLAGCRSALTKGFMKTREITLVARNEALYSLLVGKDRLTESDASNNMDAIGIVARTMTTRQEPKEQLLNLLQMATVLMRADNGVLMLAEEMFGNLKVEATLGPVAWACDKTFAALAKWVFDNNRIVHWRRDKPDERFGVLAPPVSTCLTAPLVVWDKPIGALGIASSEADKQYSKNDIELFGNFAAQAAVSLENIRLYQRLQDTYIGAIGSLAAAIEARDPYTVGHSARVTQYSVAIAESMRLTTEEIEELRLAGLLHDLGKIGVPDNILNKAGRLTEEEYSAIKMHPALSMRIIEPLPHLGNIIPIIYHHHERYDGKGYVDGKAGANIPLGARIVAVADSFEAMTSDRPYRKALTREMAISEIEKNAGSQFDPEVVRHFLALLEKTNAG